MPVISIRVSDEWLAYVDAEAERCRWKRNAAVVNLTWDGLQMRGALDKEAVNGRSKDVDIRGAGVEQAGSVERTGDGATLPVLQKAARKPVKLHPVQPVRGELVAGGGHQPGPTDEPHKGHRVYKSGDGRYCGECKVNF